MSGGDGETNDVEVDAFDAVAIDQPEAVLRRARDHRLVDPRRDDDAAHLGLAVAVGFDAVAIVAEQRSEPVETPLGGGSGYDRRRRGAARGGRGAGARAKGES